MSGPEPAWLASWRAAVDGRAQLPPGWREGPVDDPGRRAAVLVLLAEDDVEVGPDVLLTRRADTLASHPGQVAFPGGRHDPTDADDAATALRETQEEVGVDPAGVELLGSLPSLWVPPSGHRVVPVLGWWREPAPVGVVDPLEVAEVVRVPLRRLTDPANRFLVRYPERRGSGPGFRAGGLFVWGFTAHLLSWLLDLTGTAEEWPRTERYDHTGRELAAGEDG